LAVTLTTRRTEHDTINPNPLGAAVASALVIGAWAAATTGLAQRADSHDIDPDVPDAMTFVRSVLADALAEEIALTKGVDKKRRARLGTTPA
jgi:hypothetical protein